MPNSYDATMQGLRDAAAGIAQFGQNRRASKDAEAKKKEREDSAAVLAERHEAMGLEADKIKEAMDSDPDFDHKKVAQATAPLLKMAEGDPYADALLKDIRAAADASAKKKNVEAQGMTAQEKEARRATEKKDETSRADRAETDKAAKEYGDEDTTKETGKLRTSYQKMTKAAGQEPSAGRDFSLVYNFMRIQDPGSVVREKEFQTAAEARSWISANLDEDGNTKGGVNFSWLEQMLNKADPKKKGSFLLDSQVDDFTNQAESIFESTLPQQQRVDQKYLDRLGRIPGSDRKYVIPRLADEDMADIQTNRDARKKKKADKDKVSLTPEGPKKPPAKVMDEQAYGEFYKLNAPAVDAAIKAAEAPGGSNRGVPFTDEQKMNFIHQLEIKAGVQRAPGKK